MFLCYVDESGTPQIPGNTSHYVLAGISVPVWRWKNCDDELNQLKSGFGLAEAEIHVAWMRRKYIEQSKIPNFKSMSYQQRRYEVAKLRNADLLRLQREGNTKKYGQAKKNYRKSDAYIHLTYDERIELLLQVATSVSSWGFARLFAECVDKIHYDPDRAPLSVDEQAFEQVVSRFERFLEITKTENDERNYGLIIHDNNVTVSKRHTQTMKKFHHAGTFWTDVRNIIETPLFVDSELTSMVQIADLCAYSLRRYLENDEEKLFDLIFKRADRKDNIVVGVRHFTDPNCDCKICVGHRMT